MLVELLTSLNLTSWLVFLLVLMFTWYFFYSGSDKNLPPSPGIALPIVGHLYMLKKPREKFQQWRKELGNVFHVKMGSNTVVVLSSYKVLKDTLVKNADIFSDRPDKGIFADIILDGNKGVLFSSGSLWKEQRTTCLYILRNFGMGKNILAAKTSLEVDNYIKELSSFNGKPTCIHVLTKISVSNIICSIIFGRRFELDDATFNKLIDMMNDYASRISGVAIINFFPFLRKLPFDLMGAKLVREMGLRLRAFCKAFVDQGRKEYDPNNLDSFIVAYLDEMYKKQKRQEPTTLDEINLLRTITNLFAAGTETVSNTIMWAVLLSLHFPEVQEKVYQEIVDVVGTERSPNIMDKPKLKYLTATIMEVQRFASILPFSLQHQVNQDVTVLGYTIPKGAQIVPNLDSVLLDAEIWGDPENFRPERFIDAEGDVIQREEFIPFSLGRRVCLGESMAKMELFLFLSTMFQRFQFVPEDAKNLPLLKEVFGITCAPVDFNVKCMER